MHAVIIANGDLTQTPKIQPGDFIIAADGGAKQCLAFSIRPHVIIGDMDSLEDDELTTLEADGARIIRYPTRKDFTDLELAIAFAVEAGIEEVHIYAALGSRWDQTVANLLLPLAFPTLQITLVEEPQEIFYIRGGETRQIIGQPGDTFSLIPIQCEAAGITTENLEYPLKNGTLSFGSTRGVSNVLVNNRASVSLKYGILLCVHIRAASGAEGV